MMVRSPTLAPDETLIPFVVANVESPETTGSINTSRPPGLAH
jgi:hypothetical protein